MIAAVQYMANLYKSAMTDEVFSWDAASNNQLLISGQASYILNSISAYRTAQGSTPDVAADIFFGTPLEGPAGPDRALAHGHAVFNYQIPNYSKNQDTAQEFILYLLANYDQASDHSKFYNFPAFANLVAGSDQGWRLARQRSVRFAAAGQVGHTQDRQRLDGQPRLARPGQRGHRRDLRPAADPGHDGPRGPRRADAGGIGRPGRNRDQCDLRQVEGRRPHRWRPDRHGCD